MKRMIGLLKRNKLHRYLVIVTVLYVMAAVVHATDDQPVPNTFSSGDVASSSEVNANFNHLVERSWDISGTDIYYNVSGGNVGIGTDIPDFKLDVQGGSDTAINAQSSGSNAIDATSTAGGGYAAIRATTDTADTYGVWGSSTDYVGGHFESSDGTALEATTSSGYAGIFMGGNVGIDTTSPGHPLEISSGTNELLGLDLSTIGAAGNSAWTWQTFKTGGIKNWIIHGYGNSTSNDLGFYDYSNSVTTLYLQRGGNVGIGTSSPSEKLVVDGRIKVNGNNVQIGPDGNTSTYHLTTQITGTGNYGLSFISESSGQEEVAIDRLGNALFTGNVTITGNITKGSGSFIQPHATDPTKEIQYGFFEGPEHAIFLRGTGTLKGGRATIELPEYFRIVAAEEGVQVQVTPLQDCNGIFVLSKLRHRIEIKELMNGKSNASFDYFITAIRAGFEEFKPIIANTHFKPRPNETAKNFEEHYNKEDITTKAMRSMLISNGILTKDGKLNIAKAKELGWTIAQENFFSDRELRAKHIPQK